MRLAPLLVTTTILLGCSPERPAASPNAEDTPARPGRADDLEPFLRSDPELASILDDAVARRVQVLVSIPGELGFERRGWRVDAEYVFPASAVKLCTAVAALEKLEELRRTAPEVTVDTPLRFASAGDKPVTFVTTLRDEVERSLVLSDNEAYNRLLDLVGVEELGERLASHGMRSARIVHHLGRDVVAGPPAIELLPPGGPVPVGQRVGFEPEAPSVPGLLVGTAHVDAAGRLVPEPFDFRDKNRIGLRDLQDVLVSVVRPDLVAPSVVPKLSAEDREVLLGALGTLPSELPSRPPKSLDAQLAAFRTAVAAALPNDRIVSYGKGGRAYGFTVENAYVRSETTGRSAFVTLAIYANDDAVVNNDRYEYATVAEPFVTRVAQLVAREVGSPK